MSKFITKFGQTGSQSISVIGSFLGTSRQQIQNIVIQCDGQDIQGPRTIGSLMDAGILAEGGIKRNNYNHGVIYIGQIASIMPFSPMLFIEGLRGTVDENDLKHRLFLPSTASIPTSLPLSLRFSHAGGLPLGPKTRLAHLAWSIRFHKAIHSSFDMRIYNLRCKNAYVYADLTDVRDLLASIEKSIVLHESEKQHQSMIPV
ncbi:hypothetical protein BC941DRAFT_450763 [Chlamydoabsidia padenii]|nr:hypothetical protein BC941DRAFT_450763 [Chlamydoabsidia padenii]